MPITRHFKQMLSVQSHNSPSSSSSSTNRKLVDVLKDEGPPEESWDVPHHLHNAAFHVNQEVCLCVRRVYGCVCVCRRIRGVRFLALTGTLFSALLPLSPFSSSSSTSPSSSSSSSPQRVHSCSAKSIDTPIPRTTLACLTDNSHLCEGPLGRIDLCLLELKHSE